MSSHTINVTDRTYEAMKEGAEFSYWTEGEEVPAVGARVTIFDRNLDFTQHDVTKVDGRRVWVGPAIPWPKEKDEHGS